jgi:heme iron utilization protein
MPKTPQDTKTPQDAVAAAARQLIRRGLKGALATLDATTHKPYTSMVLLGTDCGGAPVTLISTLARHTHNLVASTDASLMIDASNAAGDAESGGRITLIGRFISVSPRAARQRFLARHPAASGYADFADFSFYRFELASAHFIEGFGRIVPMAGAALQMPSFDVDAFAAGEASALAQLQSRWPFASGLDPEGVDLRFPGGSDRLTFAAFAPTVGHASQAAANCLATYSVRV